jgi:hypothetical protein
VRKEEGRESDEVHKVDEVEGGGLLVLERSL